MKKKNRYYLVIVVYNQNRSSLRRRSLRYPASFSGHPLLLFNSHFSFQQKGYIICTLLYLFYSVGIEKISHFPPFNRVDRTMKQRLNSTRGRKDFSIGELRKAMPAGFGTAGLRDHSPETAWTNGDDSPMVGSSPTKHKPEHAVRKTHPAPTRPPPASHKKRGSSPKRKAKMSPKSAPIPQPVFEIDPAPSNTLLGAKPEEGEGEGEGLAAHLPHAPPTTPDELALEAGVKKPPVLAVHEEVEEDSEDRMTQRRTVIDRVSKVRYERYEAKPPPDHTEWYKTGADGSEGSDTPKPHFAPRPRYPRFSDTKERPVPSLVRSASLELTRKSLRRSGFTRSPSYLTNSIEHKTPVQKRSNSPMFYSRSPGPGTAHINDMMGRIPSVSQELPARRSTFAESPQYKKTKAVKHSPGMGLGQRVRESDQPLRRSASTAAHRSATSRANGSPQAFSRSATSDATYVMCAV